VEAMKASKFTDAEKALIVKQGDEGLTPSEMRRLRDLEAENNRLKRVVADLTLEREMLQDVIKRKL
jgi:putative transposase